MRLKAAPVENGRRRIRTCGTLGCVAHTRPIWAEHRWCPFCGEATRPWPIVATLEEDE